MQRPSSPLAVLAVFTALSLSACAPPTAPTQNPPSNTPVVTPTVAPQTPEEVWDTFVQIANNSCQEAYTGLVEEEIAGPDVGKLKVRLTFEQAGENSFASIAPNGDAAMLMYNEYFACEAEFLFVTLDEDGSSQGLLEYSPDWPIDITFDAQTGTYTTAQVMEDGSVRNLEYTVTNNLFTSVDDLDVGSTTTLTYGQPNATLTQAVNDFYADYFGY
jgi:hypothetical protein